MTNLNSWLETVPGLKTEKGETLTGLALKLSEQMIERKRLQRSTV